MTLDALNQRLRKINRPEVAATHSGRRNTWADKQFSQVVEIFAGVLQPRYTIHKTGLCCADISWDYREQIILSRLRYEMKNMLLSRSYDLVLESNLPVQWAEHSSGIKESWRITLKYGGIMRIKTCEFAVQRGGDWASRLTKALQIPLVWERLLRLELSAMELEHIAGDSTIHIRMSALRGSATWCLIPPVFQLIPMKEQDCMDLIELLQLIAHAADGIG